MLSMAIEPLTRLEPLMVCVGISAFLHPSRKVNVEVKACRPDVVPHASAIDSEDSSSATVAVIFRHRAEIGWVQLNRVCSRT